MIIEWIPCFDHRPISVVQPEADQIIIRHGAKTIAFDFSDTNSVEYEIPLEYSDYIHRAGRIDGVLYLRMPSYGRLDTPITINHGADEVLTWKT